MRNRSPLEVKFIILWKEIDGQPLQEEHRFHATRKWRFDFAHLETKIAIEIEGGIWGQSRHTKPVGYIKDCEKYNAAIFDGWDVIRLPNYWINTETLQNIKNLIKNRCQQNTQNTGQAD
jgi:very-short-patch-repair endonuclease